MVNALMILCNRIAQQPENVHRYFVDSSCNVENDTDQQAQEMKVFDAITASYIVCIPETFMLSVTLYSFIE